jgi:hypothetical protein
MRGDFLGGRPVAVRVIRTDEELMIARSVWRLFGTGVPNRNN